MAISDWFKANRLTLNLGKTVYMFFGNSKCNSKPNLKINQITLEPVESTKFLGMWVDENLNWNIHINKLINKIKRNMHLLRTPKNLFDERTLKLIYYAHIQSYIDYGLVLWGSMTTKDNLNRIQSIQNKCIEVIGKNKNIKSSFIKLKIPKIKELIKLLEIKIGYRFINKQLPNKISQQLQCNPNQKSLIKAHSYNTRGKISPITRMSYINSYLYQSIKQFMLLPLNLQNLPNSSSFITNYKCTYWT